MKNTDMLLAGMAMIAACIATIYALATKGVDQAVPWLTLAAVWLIRFDQVSER